MREKPAGYGAAVRSAGLCGAVSWEAVLCDALATLSVLAVMSGADAAAESTAVVADAMLTVGVTGAIV